MIQALLVFLVVLFVCYSALINKIVLLQADLSGIKWQKFSSDVAGLSNDPVLTAFTKCLALDILAVWRRSPKKSPDNARPNQVHSEATFFGSSQTFIGR